LQRRLERLVQLLAPLLRAGAAWMSGAAVVEADEEVLLEGRAHRSSSRRARAARKALAGSGAAAVVESSIASTLPRSSVGSPDMARRVMRRRSGEARPAASPPRARG